MGGLCACGCGNEVPQLPGAGRPRQWIDGHRPRTAKAPLPLGKCECGCGLPLVRMGARGPRPKYFPGHSPSAKARPYSVKVP